MKVTIVMDKKKKRGIFSPLPLPEKRTQMDPLVLTG